MAEEARRFPALTPRSGWQPADLEDLVGDFLADRIKPVTVMLLAQADDESSLGRLLRRSIRNWLIDNARRTGSGAVRTTLDKALTRDDRFERVPDGEAGAGRWRLVGTAGAPWAGDLDTLVDAARAVRNVRIPPWNSDRRRAPIADRASLTAVACAVLTAADGSLELAQLTHVFIRRFPAVLDHVVEPSDLDPNVVIDDEPAIETLVVAVMGAPDTAASAAEVVGMLTEEERKVLPHLEDARAVQDVLGCGRTTAYHEVKRLRSKLVQLTGDDENGRAVMMEVIHLCGGSASR